MKWFAVVARAVAVVAVAVGLTVMGRRLLLWILVAWRRQVAVYCRAFLSSVSQSPNSLVIVNESKSVGFQVETRQLKPIFIFIIFFLLRFLFLSFLSLNLSPFLSCLQKLSKPILSTETKFLYLTVLATR